MLRFGTASSGWWSCAGCWSSSMALQGSVDRVRVLVVVLVVVVERGQPGRCSKRERQRRGSVVQQLEVVRRHLAAGERQRAERVDQRGRVLAAADLRQRRLVD